MKKQPSWQLNTNWTCFSKVLGVTLWLHCQLWVLTFLQHPKLSKVHTQVRCLTMNYGLYGAVHLVLMGQIHLLLHTGPKLRIRDTYTVNSRSVQRREFHSTKKSTHRSPRWLARILWAVQRSKATANTALLPSARISAPSLLGSYVRFMYREI